MEAWFQENTGCRDVPAQLNSGSLMSAALWFSCFILILQKSEYRALEPTALGASLIGISLPLSNPFGFPWIQGSSQQDLALIQWEFRGGTLFPARKNAGGPSGGGII